MDQILNGTVTQKITPFLWFASNAEEAVEFSTSLFTNSKTTGLTRYGPAGAEAAGRPKGTVMTVTFQMNPVRPGSRGAEPK